jgi:hypothetical protein
MRHFSVWNKSDKERKFGTLYSNLYEMCNEYKVSIPAISESTSLSMSPIQSFQLLAQTPEWILSDRIILNGRVYRGRIKNDNCDHNNQKEGCSGIFIVKLIESILDLLLHIAANKNDLEEQSITSHCEIHQLWILFLNSVSILPSIDLLNYILTENEKICIFLNLYHILVLHSFIVIGAPSTLFQWSGFFSVYSYEAFGDIFSIAELEHCIIKAGKYDYIVVFIINYDLLNIF